MIVYRGLSEKYNSKIKRDIMWTSTSLEHASIYSNGEEMLKFKLNESRLVALDLQFRTAETPVNYDDIRTRLTDAILERFESNKISRERALKLIESLRDIKSSGTKPVYEWMHIREILVLIRKAGFNAIMQREGKKSHTGNVITYGIVDKTLLVRKT